MNFYEILGLEKNCSQQEIKTAFRALAKIYHPDKNETGKDFFEKLLLAYETLSDERKRKHYDYKLEYKNSASVDIKVKYKPQKNWSFDDKELKRRQYYNEHIKKNLKQTENINEEEINKTNYNEFKYVFFAIPLAVVLFLMIVKFSQSISSSSSSNKKIENKSKL